MRNASDKVGGKKSIHAFNVQYIFPKIMPLER